MVFHIQFPEVQVLINMWNWWAIESWPLVPKNAILFPTRSAAVNALKTLCLEELVLMKGKFGGILRPEHIGSLKAYTVLFCIGLSRNWIILFYKFITFNKFFQVFEYFRLFFVKVDDRKIIMVRGVYNYPKCVPKIYISNNIFMRSI